jgi:hypothetical protein
MPAIIDTLPPCALVCFVLPAAAVGYGLWYLTRNRPPRGPRG